jgi:hypothetical protein
VSRTLTLLGRRRISALLVVAGLVAVVWFAAGLPPLSEPAQYSVSSGDVTVSYTTWGIYGVFVGILAASFGLLGLISSIGD